VRDGILNFFVSMRCRKKKHHSTT